MNTKKLIIAIIIGGLLGIGLAILFAPPKIIEKPIQVSIKEPSNDWKKKDKQLDSLQTADSLRIAYLSKRITQRESTINRLKTIILNDTTKTTNEADSIIRSQDSTINDLADEAETYSRMLYIAKQQIAIRDTAIIQRDSTIDQYKDLVNIQATTIDSMEKKAILQKKKEKIGIAIGCVLLILGILK
jgi:TolA-binding protein